MASAGAVVKYEGDFEADAWAVIFAEV